MALGEVEDGAGVGGDLQDGGKVDAGLLGGPGELLGLAAVEEPVGDHDRSGGDAGEHVDDLVPGVAGVERDECAAGVRDR